MATTVANIDWNKPIRLKIDGTPAISVEPILGDKFKVNFSDRTSAVYAVDGCRLDSEHYTYDIENCTKPLQWNQPLRRKRDGALVSTFRPDFNSTTDKVVSFYGIAENSITPGGCLENFDLAELPNVDFSKPLKTRYEVEVAGSYPPSMFYPGKTRVKVKDVSTPDYDVDSITGRVFPDRVCDYDVINYQQEEVKAMATSIIDWTKPLRRKHDGLVVSYHNTAKFAHDNIVKFTDGSQDSYSLNGKNRGKDNQVISELENYEPEAKVKVSYFVIENEVALKGEYPDYDSALGKAKELAGRKDTIFSRCKIAKVVAEVTTEIKTIVVVREV